VRESLLLSGMYIAIALLFGGWVWWELGSQSGMEYLTGFAIEKSLAMDNVFVIAMIFGYFAIPRALKHRVLFWGILGVIVLRALMIGAGAALVSQYGWVLYIFAARPDRVVAHRARSMRSDITSAIRRQRGPVRQGPI